MVEMNSCQESEIKFLFFLFLEYGFAVHHPTGQRVQHDVCVIFNNLNINVDVVRGQTRVFQVFFIAVPPKRLDMKKCGVFTWMDP